MGKQQEVIKAFMASLCNSTGEDALNEAIRACSSFNSVQDVIRSMVNARNSAGSGDNFLKNYCGINLNNSDDGAITGLDAGNGIEKTRDGVIPDYYRHKNFSNSNFSINGTNIQLATVHTVPAGNSNWNIKFDGTSTFNQLSEYQKFIWQYLETCWMEGAMNLIKESYGEDFNFEGKTIYIGFTAFPSSVGGGACTTFEGNDIVLTINTNMYSGMSTSDSNYSGISNKGTYLDSLIAHELTHAIMGVKGAAGGLPQFITEGLAELTRGIDHQYKTYIESFASISSDMENKLNVNDTGTANFPVYAAGYVFLRYLAKQGAENYQASALFTNDNDNQHNTDSGRVVNAFKGNDYVNNTANNVTMIGGEGNDTLDNWAGTQNVEMYGNNGNDYFKNSGYNVTMEGGTGNDTLESWNVSNVQMYGENDNDYLQNSAGSYVTIDGGYGNDAIYNDGTNASINAGEGNDSVRNWCGNNTKIEMGEGKDSVANIRGNYVTINSGNGDDLINNEENNNSSINGGAGNDSVRNYLGHSAKIEMEAGNDSVANYKSTNVTINGGGGEDYIFNDGNYAVIFGDSNNDTISNWGNQVSVYGGYGDDHISNDVDSVTINAGYDNDFVWNFNGTNSKIELGEGRDSITNWHGSSSTIDGGSGDDFIHNNDASYSSISGGAGNDTIRNESSGRVTISGDSGNDIISIDGSSAYTVIKYTAGDGNDTIYGVKANDTLQITGAKYSRSTVGNDIKISIGSGSILLKDALNIAFTTDGTLDTVNPNSNTVIYGTGGNDSLYYNNVNYVTIYAGDGADTISGNYYNSKIYGGTGNDSINVVDNEAINWGSYILMISKYLKLTDGWSDNLTNTIDGGDGDDTINVVNFSPSSINGGGGNDIISLAGDIYALLPSRTVAGGKGNDVIYGIDDRATYSHDYDVLEYQGYIGTYYQYSYGDGNDTIYNFHSNDTISISGNSSYTTLTSGDNFVINVIGSGSIVLYNDTYNSTKDKKVSIVGGTFVEMPTFTNNADYYSNSTSSTILNAMSGNDTVINSATNVTINGDAGADSISNTAQNVGINGGDDNDKINNSGSSSTIYGGYGNDSVLSNGSYTKIYGGTGDDIIRFNGDVDYNTVAGGTGNDTIYMDNYDGRNYIQYANGDGNDAIYYLQSADTISLGGGYYTRETVGSNVIVSVIGSGAMTLYGASGKTINIVGGTLSIPAAFTNGADYYFNSTSSTILNAMSGNDTVINSATNVTINGDAGADSISNTAQSVVINGGADSDKIYNSASYVTITGGTGNDSMSLSSYANKNLIKYASGDGTDTIYGLNSDDTISITSGSYTTAVSGQDVIVKVDSGSMILKDSKGKNVTIYPTVEPVPIVTQQEVIKKFMAVLDTVTSSGVAAVSQAVSVASGGLYNHITDAISAMVSDCKNANSGNDFLLNYCGIDLSNKDTGAITGSDAGGEVVKNSEDIVPENGDLSNFTGTSFTVNGLDVQLASFDEEINPTNLSYNVLTDNQKYIWQALKTWWAESSLNIIAESYGNNYGFSSNSTATVKKLYFGFETGNSGTLATTWHWYNKYNGKSSQLAMIVNLDYYYDLDKSNPNGSNTVLPGVILFSSATYLDRTLAHEMTHAVMAANIDNFKLLPQFIKEGMAELTHGIDDERSSTISSLAGNFNRLNNSVSLYDYGTGTNDAYAGGYIFLRWLAKKSSEWSADPASQLGTTGSDLAGQALGGGGSYKDITTNGNTVTVAKSFSGTRIDLTAFDSTVTKVDATKLTKGIWIIGNERANSIVAGSGADSISGNTGNDTLIGGSGNDVIMGDAGNDTLFGDAGNDTLSGGSGKNNLTGGAGNDIFIHNGGNDVITDYEAGKDKIQIVNDYISSSSISGSNVIFTTMNGTITVTAGKGKKITLIDQDGKETTQIYPTVTPDPTPTLPSGWKYGNTAKTKLTASVASADNVDLNQTYGTSVATVEGSKITAARSFTGNEKANSIKGGSGADTISGNAGADILYGGSGNDKIYGDNDNDKLYGDAGNDSIYGGAGNDTLTGGAGNDTFFYETSNDVITDYVAGTDKIKLVSTAITSSSLSGSNVVLKTSNGNLTVKNGKNKRITVIDSNGNETTNIYPLSTLPAGLSIKSSVLTASTAFTGTKIDLANYTDATKVNAAALTNGISIVGSSTNNSLKGGKSADKIYGGAGNDTILGGAGADSLFGETGNDLLKGDAGNDTLSGGSGNDTLTGGAGSDVFIYSGGKDTITDYTAGQDKIKISSGTISKTSYSGKNVIFTVGSGTLTVKNGKGKKITITDSSGNTSTKTYTSGASVRTLDLICDNNFIADDCQLSELATLSDSKYSVGQMKVMSNTDEFDITDSIISTNIFEQK